MLLFAQVAGKSYCLTKCLEVKISSQLPAWVHGGFNFRSDAQLESDQPH